MSKGTLGLGLARALHLPPFALRTQALGGVLCKEAPTGAGGGRLGLPVRKGSGEFSIRLWGNATGRCLWHRPPRFGLAGAKPSFWRCPVLDCLGKPQAQAQFEALLYHTQIRALDRYISSWVNSK